MREITVPATKEGMLEAMELLTNLLQEKHCTPKERLQFEIAMEELLVNIVYYAYGDGCGQMSLLYEFNADNERIVLQLIVTDSGKPYDPLSRSDPDITLSAEQRTVGGLGIYMAKQYLDSLSYQRKEDKNCLMITKCFLQVRPPVEEMIYRYPQLTLQPGAGISNSKTYQDIVRRGILPSILHNPYETSINDFLRTEKTIAGVTDVLYLDCRSDFEQFVQMLAYRGEKKPIPASMGAVTISNLNNWRKILAHKTEYVNAGHTDWSQEFKRFTADPTHYKDTIIIVSNGPYSNVSAVMAGLSTKEWNRRSITIRIYHELSHVVLRRKLPVVRNPIVEEAAADAIGLYQAFGQYKSQLAKQFFGIEESNYRLGGRLENYLAPDQTIDSVRPGLENAITRMETYLRNYGSNKKRDIFNVLLQMYQDLHLA